MHAARPVNSSFKYAYAHMRASEGVDSVRRVEATMVSGNGLYKSPERAKSRSEGDRPETGPALRGGFRYVAIAVHKTLQEAET
ncbi:hypothetical protein GLAREA_08404 [Glarea lozoyensis ATCC 20868]|uniref:Uncharacterized protein n=1 Tax=Glarea lozoyensis (strain ATCC 20868 / MF5171) TaxID=1116229 RepID=S3CDE2_GLAL2|nr:uncharacterized protein GLAREA_08404 [Glarea lozoyensis ATCC 20868]EPE24552.1 hypothetical protein GLAREA_08404 [Glarea lozoyensis ATCC 20868]